MHSVIIPQKQSTILCFLLLVMASWPWRTWAEAQDPAASNNNVDSIKSQQQQNSNSDFAIQSSESALSSSSLSSQPPKGGLAKLAAQLHEEDDEISSSKNQKIHKKPVKYASGTWITSAAAASSPGTSNAIYGRRKRSTLDLEEKAAAFAIDAATAGQTGPRYLHHHNSPWKRRGSRMSHLSSATSQSEKHHHVPSSGSTLSSASAAAPESSGMPFANPADMAEPLTGHLRAAGHDMAMHMMKKRRMNGGRMYDVPQIECPRSEDRMERFACPSPDFRGRYRCIDDRSLCDGFFDCPDREDENPDMCLFYKTTKAHLDILAEALLRWARGR